MMKKSMLMLSAVLGCSLTFAAEPAKPAAQPAAKPAAPAKPAAKPAAPAKPAEPAKPAMKSITVEELTASLPKVLAKMNGKDVTKKQFVNDFLKPQIPNGKLPEMPEAQVKMQLEQFRTAAAPMLVKGYVDQLLLEQAAAKAGFKPSKDLAAKLFKAQFAKLPPQQHEMLKMQLQIQNKTEDSYIKEQAAKPEIQKMAALQQYVEKEVASKITVTPVELRAYYHRNLTRFTRPADPKDAIRASHILIQVKPGAAEAEWKKAEAKAKDIIAELKKKPETFAAVAKRESACPSKEQGGSLGAFRKGDMVPEFEKAAAALKPGAMSKTPVRTSYGYHVIRRDKLAGETVVPFDEVKPMLEKMLKGQKTQDAMLALIDSLEKQAKVEFVLKPAAPAAPAAPAKAAPSKTK